MPSAAEGLAGRHSGFASDFLVSTGDGAGSFRARLPALGWPPVPPLLLCNRLTPFCVLPGDRFCSSCTSVSMPGPCPALLAFAWVPPLLLTSSLSANPELYQLFRLLPPALCSHLSVPPPTALPPVLCPLCREAAEVLTGGGCLALGSQLKLS